MFFLHSWHPQSVAFTIGNFTVHWYGIYLALGALAGYWLISRLARLVNVEERHVANLFLWLVPTGLLGGRLYHVTNEWSYYLAHPAEIAKIWSGGLAIHGAVLAGLLVIWSYARRHHLGFWRLLDIFTPGLALGQAIGRWGNYFNQELFGGPTTLPWGIPIEPAFRPSGYELSAYFHPTFLYESLGLLLTVILLVWLFWKSTARQNFWSVPGSIALLYFFLAGLLRIGTELLRIDRVPILAGIRLPILASLLIMVAAVIILIVLHRHHRAPANHP
ncbi:MAG: prolipoprotein diacylglyceryl transferase [Candidatus Kerfeldbacteria bacterium]|nr:prolipoprotein diacylglyceryl transferase [Candidatus Kerfeldbacteria bacterium]